MLLDADVQAGVVVDRAAARVRGLVDRRADRGLMRDTASGRGGEARPDADGAPRAGA